jgi:hypothetical protein
MLLPPLDPVVKSLRKGSIRSAQILVSGDIGISAKQLDNLILGTSKPRVGTISKLINAFESVTGEVFENLFSLRSFSKKNEWRAVLDGMLQVEALDQYFPLLVRDIYHLSELDETLERLIGSPQSFKKTLQQINIHCLTEKLSLCHLSFESRRALRGSLAGFRIHVTVHLIACLDSELKFLAKQEDVTSSWRHYFEVSGAYRQLFVDTVMERAAITSINELSRYYAEYMGNDPAEATRQVRRVRAGNHAISDKMLQFFASVSINAEDEVLLYIEYYLSMYAQLQNSLINEATEKGIADQLVKADYAAFYDQCYLYCHNRRLAEGITQAASP